MVICVGCKKEITTVNNIAEIIGTKNNINECICKQCSNKLSMENNINNTIHKPCKRCRKTNVKDLPFADSEENGLCEWCRLALKAGIDDFKLFRESEKQNNTDDEMETLYGIEDLEDWGAFSDEGIMPGCHSNLSNSGYEIREQKEFLKRMKEVGLIIKAAREKIGLSIAELAKAMDMPEYMEENIENGEVYFLDKYDSNSNMAKIAVPITAVDHNMQLKGDNCDEVKKWWESCDDYELREEVWKYLYISL